MPLETIVKVSFTASIYKGLGHETVSKMRKDGNTLLDEHLAFILDMEFIVDVHVTYVDLGGVGNDSGLGCRNSVVTGRERQLG